MCRLPPTAPPHSAATGCFIDLLPLPTLLPRPRSMAAPMICSACARSTSACASAVSRRAGKPRELPLLPACRPPAACSPACLPACLPALVDVLGARAHSHLCALPSCREPCQGAQHHRRQRQRHALLPAMQARGRRRPACGCHIAAVCTAPHRTAPHRASVCCPGACLPTNSLHTHTATLPRGSRTPALPWCSKLQPLAAFHADRRSCVTSLTKRE
jgi:hypothetical protein